MNTFNEFELNRIKKFYNDQLASRLLQRSKSGRLSAGTNSTHRSASGAAPSLPGAHSPRSSPSSSSASGSSSSLSLVAATTSRPLASGFGGRAAARSTDRLQGATAAASPTPSSIQHAGVDLNRYQRAFLTKRAQAASSAGSMQHAGSNLQQLRKSVARFGRTLFDFQANNERELSLKRGDLVEMLELIDHNWARVEDCQSGLQGLVPLSYIDYSVGCAVAKRDVSGQQQVSRSCPQEAPLLAMNKGEPITLIRRLSGHWYEASNTRQANGLVWSNDLDIIKQPVLVARRSPIDRLADANDNDEQRDDDDDDDDDEEMLILETGERVLASGRRASQRRAKSAATVSGRPCQCRDCACTTTTNYHKQQEASNNFCCQQEPLGGGFRTLHSCSSMAHRQEAAADQLRPTQRSSSSPYISTTAEARQQQQLPRLCRAKFAYKPKQRDELELVVGEILMVVHECDDGWFIGTSYSSKETGTFPGNFVEPIA